MGTSQISPLVQRGSQRQIHTEERNGKFTNGQKVDFFPGEWSKVATPSQFICMFIDKNCLHWYQLSTIYRVVK